MLVLAIRAALLAAILRMLVLAIRAALVAALFGMLMVVFATWSAMVVSTEDAYSHVDAYSDE